MYLARTCPSTQPPTQPSTFSLTIALPHSLLQITTDPVELWASPTSRTRLDKDYFDSNFNPFYRTTQVIVQPKGYAWVSAGTGMKLSNEIVSGYIE